MSGIVQSRVRGLWATSYHGPSIASNQLKRRQEFETLSNDSKRQRTEAPILQIPPQPVKYLEESVMKDDESKTADNFEALKAAAAAENLVMIGPNGTTVKKEDFDALLWLNAALVTRMLLILIFDQQTLATHTLSRLSPGFGCQDRLKKPSLDFEKVSDIIYCIRERLGCSELEIRLPIIMTCSNVARSFEGK